VVLSSARRVAPTIAAGDALPRLTQRRWWQLGGHRVLRREWVFLPTWILDVDIVGARSPVESVIVSVDAIDGTVRRLDASVPLEREDEPPEGELLPTLVDADAAARHVRTEVPLQALSVAIKAGGAWSIERVALLECIGYPYLVQHLATRRTRWFRAVDGFSGALVGARTRSSLLRGFVELSRASRRGSDLDSDPAP